MQGFVKGEELSSYCDLIYRPRTNLLTCLGKPPKKSKKISQQVGNIPKNGEPPPLPLFHNNFSRFWNLKIDVFLKLLRVCE